MSSDSRVVCASAAAAGALVGSMITYLALKQRFNIATGDPTESRKLYEDEELVNQYLEFHYTAPSDFFPYQTQIKAVSDTFSFPIKVAHHAMGQYKPAVAKRALDLGCAVGATSFELSKMYDEVVGVDLSEAFIAAANRVKASDSFQFEAPDQGLIRAARKVTRPAGSRPDCIKFVVGDAQAVDPNLGTFDAVIAANLMCRVPDPQKLMFELARLVNKGGVLVITSPFSWWVGATRKETWLGGLPGGPRSEEVQKRKLREIGFELLHEGVESHLIKDHHRRYQLGTPYLTIWRKM